MRGKYREGAQKNESVALLLDSFIFRVMFWPWKVPSERSPEKVRSQLKIIFSTEIIGILDRRMEKKSEKKTQYKHTKEFRNACITKF